MFVIQQEMQGTSPRPAGRNWPLPGHMYSFCFGSPKAGDNATDTCELKMFALFVSSLHKHNILQRYMVYL